jgi:glycerol-3-phosphate dehydrogenase
MKVSHLQGLTGVRPDGARFELTLENRREMGEYKVLARSVVNATGVWVRCVNSSDRQARRNPRKL